MILSLQEAERVASLDLDQHEDAAGIFGREIHFGVRSAPVAR